MSLYELNKFIGKNAKGAKFNWELRAPGLEKVSTRSTKREGRN